MKLVIYEDSKSSQFFPIALTRAVFELKCGITSLADKIKGNFSAGTVSYFVRDYLVPTFKKRNPSDSVNDLKGILSDEILIVNGRCLLLGEKKTLIDSESWAEKDGELICAKVSKKTLSEFKEDTFEKLLDFIKAKVKKVDLDVKTVTYPWHLIDNNPAAITDDFKKMKKSGIEGTMAKESVIYGPKENVYVGKGAEIHPFVCLDTRNGPVIIDEGAEIHPYTRIEGPTYLGKKVMALGAKIREGCSIGPMCRVGGEVEESIFHACSNKYHDGFIGHTYLGEWINLGAMTTNSDLKNDYTSVKVVINGKLTDTGSIKVGSFIGDHTKTSIGTIMNTGTNLGAICLILANGKVLPKYLPSGSWYIDDKVTKGFGLKKLLETAKMAMSRRKVEFTAEDSALLEKVYEITKEDRDALIKKSRMD